MYWDLRLSFFAGGSKVIAVSQVQGDESGRSDGFRVIGSCSESLREDVGRSGMFTEFRV